MLAAALLLAAGLSAATGWLATQTTAWARMLALMGCVLWAGKVVLLLRHRARLREAPAPRVLFFVLLWPGMDARRFVLPRARPPRPSPDEWLRAVTCTVFGAGLLVLASALRSDAPTWGTWIGLFGLAYFVFFGVFHVLALGFQSVGIDAQPLFRRPRRSSNLAELWARRWNRGVHDLIRETVYAPLARRSTAFALIGTFFVSGLLHELVLSVPATGGFGLPTTYFALQAAGVALVNAPQGARWHLREGRRAWWFGFVLAFLGLPLLFPPPFHENVMRVLLHDLSIGG